jgi:hypothetical protein
MMKKTGVKKSRWTVPLSSMDYSKFIYASYYILISYSILLGNFWIKGVFSSSYVKKRLFMVVIFILRSVLTCHTRSGQLAFPHGSGHCRTDAPIPCLGAFPPCGTSSSLCGSG